MRGEEEMEEKLREECGVFGAVLGLSLIHI